MPWAGGLDFGEIVALALLILAALIVLGPDKATRLIQSLRKNGNGNGEGFPRIANGKPFVIAQASEVEALREAIKRLEAESERFEQDIYGADGLIQQIGEVRAACRRLEAKVDAQPTRADLLQLQTTLAADVAAGLKSIRTWLAASRT